MKITINSTDIDLTLNENLPSEDSSQKNISRGSSSMVTNPSNDNLRENEEYIDTDEVNNNKTAPLDEKYSSLNIDCSDVCDNEKGYEKHFFSGIIIGVLISSLIAILPSQFAQTLEVISGGSLDIEQIMNFVTPALIPVFVCAIILYDGRLFRYKGYNVIFAILLVLLSFLPVLVKFYPEVVIDTVNRIF